MFCELEKHPGAGLMVGSPFSICVCLCHRKRRERQRGRESRAQCAWEQHRVDFYKVVTWEVVVVVVGFIHISVVGFSFRSHKTNARVAFFFSFFFSPFG